MEPSGQSQVRGGVTRTAVLDGNDLILLYWFLPGGEPDINNASQAFSPSLCSSL